ncbi:NACHT domain-containing protein [Streptomyces sp. NPDC001889]
MTRTPHPARRTWLRVVLIAVLACTSLLLAWGARDAEFGSVEQLMAIASTFAGLGSLGAAVFQLLPPPAPPRDAGEVADQLADSVSGQWTEEATARELREPRVIPLSWAATERQVAARAEAIFGTRTGRVLRMSLEGRLEGDFSTACAQLADGYGRIPSGRLVVLGEPGGGKTVLALMLTLGLLAQRAPQGPVPVMLSVSSWDPVNKSLDDWITDTLAAQYYGGQTHAPRLLLSRQMLLPVLDGLDEIPEAARRNAVRALNAACGDGRGLVLTCRSTEYQDVIEGGSAPLRRAPVVEVAAVPVVDAVNYLAEVDWPEGVDWRPVYARLDEHPEGAAATALSTPLTLTLARSVYRNCGRDPAELLDFDSRHGVEDHLVDHIIPAAYAPAPGSLPLPDDDTWQRNAEQAERYLTFLATHLHGYGERDLAWWRMSGRLFSRWAGLVVGLSLGLLTMLLAAGVQKLLGGDVGYAAVLGAGVAVLAMLTWYAAPERPPGRVSFARRGSLRRLCAGFGAGFALASAPAVMVLGTQAVMTTYGEGWTTADVVALSQMAAFAAGAALAVGAAFAVHQWLNTPPEGSARATPVGLLHQDRNSALVGAGLAGVIFGAAAVPLLVTSVSLAFVVFLALMGWAGEPRLTDILARVTDETGAYDSLPRVLAATVLLGTVFSVLMLLHRAWTKFALLRVFLAAGGKVPWNFVRFLSDARDRQLLRQSGGTYQFRHIHLQERLAGRSLARDRALVPRAHLVRRRRIRLASAGGALAVVLLLITLIVPGDPSRITLSTGRIDAMSFGPAGTRTLVTADRDGIVRRWDTENGEKVWERRISGLVDWTDYDYGEDEYTFDMSIEVNRDGVLLFGEDENQSPREWKIPWNRSERITDKEINSYSVVDTAARGRYQFGINGVDTYFMDTRADSDLGVHGGVYLGEYYGGAVSESGVLVTFLGDSRTIDVYESGVKQRRCGDMPGERWAIDNTGERLASALGATAHGWDRCAKDWSFDTHKPIDALALSGNGAELALTVDGMTRIYDTSELD